MFFKLQAKNHWPNTCESTVFQPWTCCHATAVTCCPHLNRWNGTVWFIEVKAPDGKLTALQERFGRRMKELKQNYAVLYTKEEVDAWFAGLNGR